ncbi:MAG: S8 family serine peptidase [Candidatus Geothermincolia bacterium]
MGTKERWLAIGLFLALVLSLALGFGFGGRQASAGGPKIAGEYVPGELVVKFKDGVPNSTKDKVLASDKLSVLSQSPRLKFKVVKVPVGSTVPEMVSRLSADPSVEYAEPNYVDHIAMTPNDPLYPDQWHMQGFASGGIDATAAWDTEEGSPGVIVAVVDTGVAFENYDAYQQAPDLAGTTFVSPHDSVDGDTHPVDHSGHGTHVTGTVAQTTNNALGTAGAAHGCAIMPIRCLGPGGGSHAQMADAFAWAADHGAKVINYSASGSDSQTKRDGCKYAYEAGVTICAASGNQTGAIQYPAAYSEYCIAVGATARNKTLAFYSNFGPQQCVVGPGGDIRTTSADGVLQQTYVTAEDPSSGFSYQGWQGTSMACPHVSAAAALFISHTGVSNPDAVKMQLELTAHDLGGAGRDDYFGYGLVDANRALVPAVPLIDHVAPGTGPWGTSVTVTGAGFGDTRGTSTVTFNGMPATEYTSWSDSQVVAVVPEGALIGPLRVTTAQGTSNSVEFVVEYAAPTLTGVAPSYGANDSSLNITNLQGTGFRAGASVKLTRAGESDIAATGVSVQSTRKISCAVNLTGKAIGQWSVVVTNDDARSGTLINGFSVKYPAPTVAGIAPSSGTKGQTVSISNLAGTNFRAGATVRLKKSGAPDIVATGVTVTSAKITCSFNLAGAAVGAWNVCVTNTDGQSAVKNGGFTVGAAVYPDWYLAEGSCASPFSTYISIENPNSTAVHAVLTYMTASGAVAGGTVTLPARSQATVNPASQVGASDFSTRVVCSERKTICCERMMTWQGAGAASPEGHSSVGVPEPAKTWYLPEGSSEWGFDCWIALMNPTSSAATVKLTYMIEGSGAVTRTKTVGPFRRASVNMATDIGAADASIKVESNVPVVPERSMYRNNMREGHCSIGTTAASTNYYLAEGTSAWGFTSYVLVQNPNSSAASVTITYMTGTGPVSMPAFSLAASSRETIRVNDVLPNVDFSVRVTGSKPIIAERAMYWDNGTGEACHDSIGVATPHAAFYCPDGQSTGGVETWTLVQNPNSSAVTIEVTYMTPAGSGNVVFTDAVAAYSRKTYALENRLTGRAAIRVISKTSGKKVIVERAMYWNSRGAGADTIGGYSD